MELSPEIEAFIEEEQTKLQAVSRQLEEQLSSSANKLVRESKRARELTAQLVAASRDEDKQMLASDEAVSHAVTHLKAADIKTLEKLLERPYFARFVVKEATTGQVQQLEYKLGFAANPDCRIIDWRKAPISKLYYEYREGDEYAEEVQGRERQGEIILRNSVEAKRDRLQKLNCRYGSFAREEGKWTQLSGGGLSRALSGTLSYGELPQILALITKDQFQTITEDSDTAILIQGIAGSGKTTVALHRLAWLLHENNSDLKTDECLVLVLHRALQAYISQTLPSMGITGVRVVTFGEWALDSLKHGLPEFFSAEGARKRPRQHVPKSIERVLRSFALLKTVESYEYELRDKTFDRLKQELPLGQLPRGINSIIETALLKKRALNPFLKDVKEGIDRGLRSIQPSHSTYNPLIEAARFISQVKEELPSYLSQIIAALESRNLFDNDETKLIDKALVENTLAHLKLNSSNEMLDACVDPLLFRLIQVRTGATFFKDGRSGRYRHIVADEVQDLSATELACIIGAVESSKQLTLVGDTAQNIYETSTFPGWERLMKHWNFHEDLSRYISLTVSHRSTLPIMELADYVQDRSLVTEGRAGRVPIWFKCNTESKGILSCINWLTQALERYPGAVTAVICSDPAEAKYALSLLSPSFGSAIRLGDQYSFSFDEGIVVTNVAQVKGLEFHNVLLWNPSSTNYPNHHLGRNSLYVGITRAEENLCLVTWKRPSTFLPDIFSKIVRGIDTSIDEM